MIRAYSWNTPNGHKLHIMLEEVGLEYDLIPIAIGKGEQFSDEYKRISPNSKIPAIVDTDGPDGEEIALMESGAILLYLGEKTGQLIPQDSLSFQAMREWLFFQVAHVGPMFGQAHHFDSYAPERIEYAIERYTNESKRLMSVLETRLASNPYLAGEQYSIADIATFPWVIAGAKAVNVDNYPAVARWVATIHKRPAVARGLALMETGEKLELDSETKKNLFGQRDK